MKTYPLVSLPDVPGEVVHRDVLVAVRTASLLSQVNALHVIVQQFLGLELLLAVTALIVPDLLVEILDMMVEILVLLVADVTGRGLGQMHLLDVVLQGVLRDKLLFAEGAFRHLGKSMLKLLRCLLVFMFTLL